MCYKSGQVTNRIFLPFLVDVFTSHFLWCDVIIAFRASRLCNYDIITHFLIFGEIVLGYYAEYKVLSGQIKYFKNIFLR
eukprot:TRINITY_DN247_c1_g2_i1.p1 TRINITY_DN247_c1_g2~~TRINITY_DN247_c1_g2_i1.p1  ORF type:complete len:79 (+),score=0.17 TRINITY_DN247_c1_g2_i1:287-523(+)